MNISKIEKSIAFVMACIFLSSCVLSMQPLGEENPLPTDSALIGSWKLTNDGDLSYLHIGNSGGSIEVVSVDIRKDGMIKTETLKAISTELNGLNYLSLCVDDGSGKKYLFLKYKIEEGKRLKFWSADQLLFREALMQGRLQGINNDKSIVPNVLLSANQSELREFVVKNDARIFKEELSTFDRVE